jgi:hypothetical protein
VEVTLARSALAALAGLAALTGGDVVGPAWVDVDLHVRALCPFGLQMEQELARLVRALGDHVNVRVEYMLVHDSSGAVITPPDEVHASRIKVCAGRIAESRRQFFEFLNCVNGDWHDIDRVWRACAEGARLPARELERCEDGPEGEALLSASSRRTDALGSTESPTLYLNGERYRAGRAAAYLVRAVCERLGERAPRRCRNLPAPAPVEAVLLTDRRCASCDASGAVDEVRTSVFPTMSLRTVDYSTEEGRRLYQELALDHLPALLFEPGVERAEGYAFFSQLMAPLPSGGMLWPIGGSYKPEDQGGRAAGP